MSAYSNVLLVLDDFDASRAVSLGGFGNGPLPRVDSLGSRSFLLRLMPHLSTVPSAFKSVSNATTSAPLTRRVRALDVGAGIGRVTATVLLPLVPDVVLLEPVGNFINQAKKLSTARGAAWRGIAEGSKSVTFIQGTLQAFDPAAPLPLPSVTSAKAKLEAGELVNLGRVGCDPPSSNSAEVGIEEGYDVIWCQWCLGHMTDPELVNFFKRCKKALRPPSDSSHPKSLIIVKENTCFDKEDGSADGVFDEEDSSVTRSNQAWLDAFKAADLTLIKQETQHGLPEGLFIVITYALR